MVLEHRRGAFDEMLRYGEGSHETLDKRLKWRIESRLEEMFRRFQLLGICYTSEVLGETLQVGAN
jgi:hypothetical protein